jgi:hypothetical protein
MEKNSTGECSLFFSVYRAICVESFYRPGVVTHDSRIGLRLPVALSKYLEVFFRRIFGLKNSDEKNRSKNLELDLSSGFSASAVRAFETLPEWTTASGC